MGFQPSYDGVIQVHNNECSHWVTSTSGILNQGYVCMTLYQQYTCPSIEEATSRSLLYTSRRKWQNPVQRQLIIAFATSVCLGIDPNTVAFSERSLGRHIHECVSSIWEDDTLSSCKKKYHKRKRSSHLYHHILHLLPPSSRQGDD